MFNMYLIHERITSIAADSRIAVSIWSELWMRLDSGNLGALN